MQNQRIIKHQNEMIQKLNKQVKQLEKMNQELKKYNNKELSEKSVGTEPVVSVKLDSNVKSSPKFDPNFETKRELIEF